MGLIPAGFTADFPRTRSQHPLADPGSALPLSDRSPLVRVIGITGSDEGRHKEAPALLLWTAGPAVPWVFLSRPLKNEAAA
jgi:hypothetical protein